MVLDKRTLPMDAVGYIVAQAVGAIGAAAFVLVVAGQASVTAGITKPGGGVTEIGALLLETVLTAGFVAVILTATKRAPLLAPLAIPLTLVAIHFASAPLSGASVNPVRSLGSALIGGDLAGLWIYIVAPIVGSVVGWAVFRVIDGGGEEALG
jgi:aquaporin Z